MGSLDEGCVVGSPGVILGDHEGRHPQRPMLPAGINGKVAAGDVGVLCDGV